MTMFKQVVFIGMFLLLTACGTTAVTPEAPSPTAEQAAAVVTSTQAATATPTDEPNTATPPPAPATATAQPTSTTPPTATNTAAATATTEPTETAVSTATIAVATAVSTTSEATATAAATTAAAPPAVAGGSVPAPSDQNYPGNDDRGGWEARINVPAGFTASYYGRIEGNPTSITFGPDGRLYVAIQQGSIFRMDESGNPTFYVGGFNSPTGIAFQPGTNRLFVASRVRDENVGGESQIFVVNEGQLIGGLPCCYTGMHAANGIAFGPDGWGYVGVGGRADHGEILGTNEQDELHPYEASILRFNPNGGGVEVYARGLRNPYDITWDANGQLWASDNAPDYGPPEEIHRVVPGGQHGYPYYDCDVCFSPPPDVQVLPPVYTLVPHASPTGITAYTSSQFPANYYNNLFVTLWSAFPGAQKVMRLASGPPSNFATGFAAPIDVEIAPDGSMFVADWATGIIFKISYTG